VSERIRARLTYANVVATLCLFLLLGGAAYAATQLPKNSVGTKQIKNGAVTQKKISKSAQAALRGLQGPPGATGQTGPPGASAAFGAPLPSGKSEVGPWTTRGNSGGGAFSIRFEPPLAHPLDGAHMHYLTSGNTSADCPGQGEGSPGNLCVYATADLSFQGFSNPVTNAATSQTYGVNLSWFTDGSTSFGYGTWALTAP
jgi:hypothetical protein